MSELIRFKKLLLVGFVLLISVLGTVFLMRSVEKRNMSLQTKLIKEQGRQKENMEFEEKVKKRKEERAIKQGLAKMLTGYVDEINDDEIVIDTDPLGKHQKYTIILTSKTSYYTLRNEEIYEENELDGEGHPVKKVDTKIEQQSNDSFLEKGKMIEVHLPERLDIHSATKLYAEKIIIFIS